MRLLLDAHSFLWFVEDSPKLSDRAKHLIEDGENQVYLSTVSIWEMAIKVRIGKLNLGSPFAEFVSHQLEHNAITLLDMQLGHINLIATLPLHHRDPFDRLLIAQSIVEQMPILSADEAFDDYPVTRLW